MPRAAYAGIKGYIMPTGQKHAKYIHFFLCKALDDFD
jgi:hypothetical protein